MDKDAKRKLHQELTEAFWSIRRLQEGLPLAFAPIQDPEQLKELIRAKDAILRALDWVNGIS